jgi:3-hydroxyisobutyrate dehydrogenase
VAATLAGAVAGADAVVTMLPAGRHVGGGWTELAGLVAPGTLLIDSSTVDVDSARAAHALAAGRGCPAVDAPVSGGTAGAAAGTLTFMVGGAQDAFAKAEPILSAMGRRVVRCGDGGAGQAAKICNNMLLGISMIGACEAFALAERLGLEADRFFDIASKSSGQCWSLTSYSPWPGQVETAPSNRDYAGGFAVAMMLKDLKLAQAAAAVSGASTPLGAQAEALYALWDRLGNGGRDFSSMLQFLRGGT